LPDTQRKLQLPLTIAYSENMSALN